MMMMMLCRVEKEKAQVKAEADDLRGQLDHAAKGKVSYIRENCSKSKFLTQSRVTNILIIPGP